MSIEIKMATSLHAQAIQVGGMEGPTYRLNARN